MLRLKGYLSRHPSLYRSTCYVRKALRGRIYHPLIYLRQSSDDLSYILIDNDALMKSKRLDVQKNKINAYRDG